ncbi:MAG: D-glucuronyl C5-epimerase family protein [Solirubrobacteraceae bacterium]
MRGKPVLALLVLLVLGAVPSGAAAAPVLVLGRDGHASVRNDPFVSGPARTPAPVAGAASRPVAGAASRAPATITSELARLYRLHAITQAAYRQYGASFKRALATEKRLRGTRLGELEAVTETLHQIAAAGSLTPSRLPALFSTLDRNREWWSTGPLPSSGERVEFAGSQLVWEYYPGQGIQLQVLGSFGKADGLYTAGRADYPAMEQLLSELIPLAAQRGGGLAWEYYFHFDGGAPPWTSAMSQATGLEALTRAYQATGNRYYLGVANQALPLFSVGPPIGVELQTPLGRRYLQYTFAPGASIINAFLQTLIGLDDYAHVSGDPQAAQLFAAGDAEAMAEVPQFDTGAWSLYQPGVEDSLDYHELVTGFLRRLCALTAATVYCATAQRFRSYLTTPPALQQLTLRGRARKAIVLRFRLSKVSRVGVVVTQGRTTIFQTSANFPYGVDRVTIPALRRPGAYGIRLAATDLAGNFARSTGTLQVSP